MKTIKVKTITSIPSDYTGIIELLDETKLWYKNGKIHREDGPARIYKGGFKVWYLEEKTIWNSGCQLDLTNQIILSKTKHPEYPSVQVWKILNKNEVYERIVVPGMEEYIQE